MKFTIDTEKKVINIEEKVTLLELLELVMVLNSDAENYEVKIINKEEKENKEKKENKDENKEDDIYKDFLNKFFNINTKI